jgi:hypothetical protein
MEVYSGGASRQLGFGEMRNSSSCTLDSSSWVPSGIRLGCPKEL